MPEAVVGLLGALVGATAALVGAMLTARLQARYDRERAYRDRRQAAYDGALRHLLRGISRRSELDQRDHSVVAVMGEELVGPWIEDLIEDLIEAQFWLHSLPAVCGREQRPRITGAAGEIDKLLNRITSGGLKRITSGEGEPAAGPDALRKAFELVRTCAEEELHRPHIE